MEKKKLDNTSEMLPIADSILPTKESISLTLKSTSTKQGWERTRTNKQKKKSTFWNFAYSGSILRFYTSQLPIQFSQLKTQIGNKKKVNVSEILPTKGRFH